MYPAHGRGISSCPHHPSWDFTPPESNKDTMPPGTSFMYEPWPQNCSYPVPLQSPNCNNHTQCPPPYYNFSPFYPHFPSPQPAYTHLCGGYPNSYYVTPPHYEYDSKAHGRFHCCGCPNHRPHFKIEDHEPEVNTDKSESLVPAEVNDVTHPIFWIPPGFVINKEQPRRVVEEEQAHRQHVSPYYYIGKPQLQGRPTETDAEEQHVKKLQWQPRPIDSGGEHIETPSMNKDVDNVANKQLNKKFPFPIIRMPYGAQEENHVKGKELKGTGEAPSKEAYPPVKVIPMKFEHPVYEPEKIKTAVGDNGNGVGKRSSEKTSSVKIIPVKQLEERVPETVKRDEERKTAVKNGNGNSSSPTKKSKLPPICLRVDPPKKKNSNCTSRSPSLPEVSKKNGLSKKEIKVSEAEDRPSSQSKIEVLYKTGDSDKKGAEGQESRGVKESKPQEAKNPERKILSEEQAATVIQSVYRGYDVRRWEPLKKLKQIAMIRDEAGDVKKRIDDLESCSGASMNDREITIVSEIIMNLLLKLDSIQGLHPSFRDARRSLAKELTVLQEKLDRKKSAPFVQETPSVEDHAKVSEQDGSSKGVVETAEEPSKVCTVEVPSSISDIGVDIGEIGKVLNLVEGSEAKDKVSSIPCFIVGGSENEDSFETSDVKVESQSDPKYEMANSPPVSINMTEVADCVAANDVQGKLSAGSKDLTDSNENMVELCGRHDEHLNVFAQGPLPIVEGDRNESSQVDVSIESAPSTPLEVESETDHRNGEANRRPQIDFPQEGIEECIKKQTSDFPTSETLNVVQHEDQSGGDTNGGAAQSIEPETFKPDPSEMLSINDYQNDESAVEKKAEEFEPGVSPKPEESEDDKTKLIPQTNGVELISATKSNEEEEQIENRVIEENKNLREIVERLIASGKEQQDMISSLSRKLKDLEKKFARNTKSTMWSRVQVSRPRSGSLRKGSGS